MTDILFEPSQQQRMRPLSDHGLHEHTLTACALVVQRGDVPLSTGLNFSLAAGQILHVRGRNGAGKSTLLQMLAGLLPLAQRDMLHWGHVPPADWPILYIGHKTGLSSALSVADNLMFLQQLNRGDCDEIAAALAVVGLAGYEDTAVAQLSSGQKRRVQLARLWLSGEQMLWLLDEPLTALDQEMAASVGARIAAYAASGGRVILTSHQPLNIGVNTLDLDQCGVLLTSDTGVDEYSNV